MKFYIMNNRCRKTTGALPLKVVWLCPTVNGYSVFKTLQPSVANTLFLPYNCNTLEGFICTHDIGLCLRFQSYKILVLKSFQKMRYVGKKPSNIVKDYKTTLLWIIQYLSFKSTFVQEILHFKKDYSTC